MKTHVVVLTSRSVRADPAVNQLVADYLARASHFLSCEEKYSPTEVSFFGSLDRTSGRIRPYLILLDSRGQQFTSEEFAACLGRLRDVGTQRLVFAVGPASGWSPAARGRADLLFSLGRLTLPHHLARVVLAEQIYRATTILSGHPYHSGH